MAHLIKYLLIFLALFSVSPAKILSAPFFDTGDDFIEETFEVKIPGLEGAYNASIIEYEGGYLMAFRYDTCKVPIHLHLPDYYQYIGIIRLDENFQPQGPWYPCLGNRTYDPRLLNIDGTIYLIFASPRATELQSTLSSHLNMCTVQCTADGFTVHDLVELSAPCQQEWEKNWVPFAYKNKMHLAYTIDPHAILRPTLLDGTCEMLSNSSSRIYWPFGIIRGGTPALLVDDHYLGFFHSSIYLPELGYFNYSVGAYTYAAKPPFKVLKSSAKPFSHPDFYSSQKRALTTANVLFPGGFVVKGEKIYLCYGENDAVIKIMVLNKNALYKSLGL